MTQKRRGLGRGLGALIPTSTERPGGDRPVDVFFPGAAAEEVGGGGLGHRAGDGTPASGAPTEEPTSPSDAPSDVLTDGRTEPQDESPGGSQEAGRPGPELVDVPGARFAEVPLDAISPNPRQPRTEFDVDALAELVHSIGEIGVLQPVVVREVGAADDGSARFELVMGERRWRASREAGLATIPAIVRETGDEDLLRDALLENLHRSELNPLEEAAAYNQLLEDFGCTHDELARRIGRSRPQISNTVRLLRLPPAVQRRVAAGVLSAGHARALLALPDADAMDRLATRIVAEGLSVRTTEEVVALGGDAAPAPTRRRATAGQRQDALDSLAARLSDRFDTRVTIGLGRRKGKVTVEFATVDDLNRIVAVLSPDDPGLFPGR